MKKKKISLKDSLKGVLILIMILLAVVPTVLVGIIGSTTTTAQLKTVKQNELMSVVNVQDAIILDWMNTRLNEINAMAQNSTIISMNKEDLPFVIDKFFSEFPYYETLYVSDLNGNAITNSADHANSSSGGDTMSVGDRDYFQKAVKGEANISDALINRATGNVAIVFAVPIHNASNKIVGVVAGVSPTTTIEHILKTAYPGNTGDIYLINQSGFFISPSRFDEQILKAGLVKDRIELELKADNAAAKGVLAGNSSTTEYKNVLGEQVIAAYKPIGSTGFGIIAEQQTQEAYQSAIMLRNLTMIIIVITLVLVVFLATLFAIRLTKPIEHLSQAADLLAEGDVKLTGLDLTFMNKILDRKDEVGQTAKAMRNMIDYFQYMTDVATHIADGNLSDSVVPKSENDLFGNAFSRMIHNLRDLIGQVKVNAEHVTRASNELKSVAEQTGLAINQVAATIQQVSSGTSDQAGSASNAASSVQNVSNAIEKVGRGVQEQTDAIESVSLATSDINGIIQQVGENVKQATNGAGKAADLSRSGARTVEQTISGMRSIQAKVSVSAEKIQEMGKRSQEIGAIVETIEDIASQTNLLALNAAIEAARAGEHGKGFAVVADEVRKLAERSSNSTKEINDLITGIQHTVSEAVVAMDEGSKEVNVGMLKAGEAGDALSQILGSVEAVYEEIGRVQEAAETMMGASKTLVNAVDQVSNVIDANRESVDQMTELSNTMAVSIESIASVAEENSAAVEEVSASTEELSAQSEEVAASANAMLEMSETLKDLVMRFELDQSNM